MDETNDDELDVAYDAHARGDVATLERMSLHAADGLVRIAERLHRRGDAETAGTVYQEARRRSPRICLRGDARVLAVRTRENLKAEIADVMQWNPRGFRLGCSTSPSTTIQRFDTSYSRDWRAWWTHEDAERAALRQAWCNAMENAVEIARITGERVSRRQVGDDARAVVEHLVAERGGFGELLGCPGPLITTVSGFVLCQDF